MAKKDSDQGIEKKNLLPDYAPELRAFHEEFRGELKSLVQSLPLGVSDRVADVGCGDGFYVELLAERLGPGGEIVGLDANRKFLEVGRKRLEKKKWPCRVSFEEAELSSLPSDESFDFVWCAQSLYSFPEPVAALKAMARMLKPSGILAVLENDTIHQLLLPWPSEFELQVRVAERKAFEKESNNPQKFYVGRRLPSLLASAGIEPLHFKTHVADRASPMSPDLEFFVESYLKTLEEKTGISLTGLVSLLHKPHFTISWVNLLTYGKKAR